MQEKLRKIPGVDKLLNHPKLKKIKYEFGKEIVVYCIRTVLQNIRKQALQGNEINDTDEIIQKIQKEITKIIDGSLKPVVNATGIILHTNLGRAPFGKKIFREIESVLTGYSNLEFDLKTGKRGHRNNLLRNIL